MASEENRLLKRLSDPATRRQTFAELVQRYSEPLYWKIRHIVIRHEDANDVLQNTFVKAWNNLNAFQGKSQFSTWLYRIAINESLDFLRRQKTIVLLRSHADLSLADRLMADEYFDGDAMQARLQEAIASVPDVQRTVFNLRYYDEMKYSEMSQLLGTSEGSLKASYHLAVKKITAYFKRTD